MHWAETPKKKRGGEGEVLFKQETKWIHDTLSDAGLRGGRASVQRRA